MKHIPGESHEDFIKRLQKITDFYSYTLGGLFLALIPTLFFVALFNAGAFK